MCRSPLAFGGDAGSTTGRLARADVSGSMVGVPGQDRGGAVELLGQHHADQPVRPGQAAEGELQVGCGQRARRQGRPARRSGRPPRAGPPSRQPAELAREVVAGRGRGRARPAPRRRHPAGIAASSRSASAALRRSGGRCRAAAPRPGAIGQGQRRAYSANRVSIGASRLRPTATTSSSMTAQRVAAAASAAARRGAPPTRASRCRRRSGSRRGTGGPARRRRRSGSRSLAGILRAPRPGHSRWPAALSRSTRFSAIDAMCRCEVPVATTMNSASVVLPARSIDGGVEGLVVVEGSVTSSSSALGWRRGLPAWRRSRSSSEMISVSSTPRLPGRFRTSPDCRGGGRVRAQPHEHPGRRRAARQLRGPRLRQPGGRQATRHRPRQRSIRIGMALEHRNRAGGEDARATVRQRGSCARLSAPISQTKRWPGQVAEPAPACRRCSACRAGSPAPAPCSRGWRAIASRAGRRARPAAPCRPPP